MSYVKLVLGDLLSPSQVLRKMDLFGAAIDQATQLTAMGGSALGNLWERNTQKDNNQANREFNDYQNALDRYFSALMQYHAQKWQTEEWNRQFAAENEYNSPANQASRLRAAGLNPAALFGQVGTAQGATPNTPIASTPSVPKGLGVSNTYTPNYTNPFAAFRDIGEGLKQVAEAKKLGVDTKLIEESFEDQLKKIQAEARFAELNTIFTERYGDEKYNQQVRLIRSQVEEIGQKALNLAYEGEIVRAESLFAEESSKIKFHMLGDQASMVYNEAKTWWTRFKADLNRVYSETYKNTTQGDLNISEKNLNVQTRAIRTPDEIRAAIESMSIGDNEQSVRGYYDRIIKNDLSDQQIKSINNTAAKISATVDLATLPYDKFIDKVSSTLEVAEEAVQVIVPIAKYRQLQRGIDSMNERNDIKRRELGAIDVKTTETFNNRGERTGFTTEKKFKNRRPKN